MTVQVVTAIFGAILIIAAIFNRIRTPYGELPSLPPLSRILCGFLGVGLISLSFWVDLRPPSGDAREFPPPGETTTSIPRTTHQPSTSTAAGPSNIAIQVRRADGGSGPLGRDVQLVGHIRGLSKPWSCYWGGWHVHAADGWTGRFIKGELALARDGSFKLTGLQMGSEGETTSEWRPFVLGATPDGCALLLRNLEKTQIGSYRGPWPPPGAKVLYQGPPVGRGE